MADAQDPQKPQTPRELARARTIAQIVQLGREHLALHGAAALSLVVAACELGQRPEYAGKRIVVIIPSFAERYLSTALFEGLD